MNDERSGFWQSGFGKFCRWILFLPAGFILLGVIEFLSILGTVWLFDGDLRMFIIIGVLFGALFTAIPFVVMAYYGTIWMAAGMICPSPKVGAIIFGTLYFLWMIPSFIKVFGMEVGAGIIVPTVILKVIFLITAVVSLVSIHQES